MKLPRYLLLLVFILTKNAWGQMNIVTCGSDPAVDDTPAVISALSQPVTQNTSAAKVAFIPANQTCYVNLTGANALPAGSRLTGIPGRSVLKPFSAGNPILSVIGADATHTVDGVSVEGITFDGAATNLNGATPALVAVKWSNGFRFTHNVIRSSGGDVTAGEALSVTDASATIEDNDISNFGTQVEIFADSAAGLPASAAVTLSNNRIYNNSSGGGNAIWVHGADAGPIDFGVLISGNFINNTVAGAGGANSGNSILLFGVQKVRISHNFASRAQSSCYRSTFSRDLIFTGNQCSGAGGAGMVSELGSQHNQWANNYVENAAGACISVVTANTANGPVQSHTIIGNHLLNCGTWGIGVDAESSVSGNLIDHASTGIQVGLNSGRNVTVRDNLIVDTNPSGSGATVAGIGIMAGAAGGLIVEGNQFDLSTAFIVGVQSGSAGPIPAGVTVRNQSVPQQYLGTPDSGSSVYCPNCAPGNCTAQGAGAFARRVSGAWICE